MRPPDTEPEPPAPDGLAAPSVARAPRRYELLASAIAGRKVSVTLQDTDVAHSNGETVFLPSGRADEELLAALVAQCALIAAGSLDPRVVIRLVARASASRRYVTLELSRALADPGVPIPRALRHHLSIWDGPLTASPVESLREAVTSARIPEAPLELGTVRARKVLTGSRGAGLVSSLARRPPDTGAQQVDVDELDDDEDSEESKILKIFSSPFSFENPIFRLLRSQLGMGRRPKADGDDGGAELPVAGASAVAQVGANARLMDAPADLELGVSEHEAGDRYYWEWDGHRGAYRDAWCAVGEFLPASDEPNNEFAPLPDLALRRELASLGLAYERHRHQADGDGIDVHALVEFAVSKAMGETPDDHVYQARLKTAHDLGVLVLLDASGSTAQHANGAPVWNQHRHLAANLIGALEQVGDRVAAFGFNSRGRQHVRFLLVKDFDHRFDAAAVRRLANLTPSGFTRLGAAIRHATHLIATQAGTSNRLIVVVSDGFAYDDGYRGAYAEMDTRRALDEAVAEGIGCVCVSVASDIRNDAVERLWGSVTHVQLGEAAELSHHLVPMFQTALKAVRAPRAPATRGARAS